VRRGIQAGMLLAVVLILPLLWVFRPVWSLPARFSAADCRRAEVAAVGSREPISGIEDMALLPDGETIVFSAYDRRAFDARPATAPEGGLYEISLARLSDRPIYAVAIVPQSAIAGGLFPQGIAVSSDGRRLAFINRNRDGTVSLIGGRLRQGGFEPTAERSEREFCRANDLEFAGDSDFTVEVTLDRRDSGTAWSDLRPGAQTGRVISVDLETAMPTKVERDGLAFANGIAGLYVSETRAERLSHLLDEPVYLPGGPDNLTWDTGGGLIAALHPSLMRIAAYRFGVINHAPSRIVRLDLDRRLEVLFDDTEGEIFSGASAAVMAGDTMVAGSVRDSGLLVCRKGGA